MPSSQRLTVVGQSRKMPVTDMTERLKRRFRHSVLTFLSFNPGLNSVKTLFSFNPGLIKGKLLVLSNKN